MSAAPLVPRHHVAAALDITMYVFYEGEPENNESGEEYSTNYQSDNVDNIQASEEHTSCTPVYSESGEYTCAEYLIPNQNEETQTVEIEKTEEQLEYDETLLTTLQSIEENQETIIQSQDNTVALEIYENIETKLNDIYDYVSVAVGLYFIAWILSIFNTWRRSNK